MEEDLAPLLLPEACGGVMSAVFIGPHDGCDAEVMHTHSPTWLAAQLGTEDGTRAAKQWKRDCAENLASIAAGYDNCDPCPRPQPDPLTPNVLGDSLSFGPDGTGPEIMDAYEAAFTAAVEATIREACKGRSSS